MNNGPKIVADKPADPREVVRVNCVRLGVCPLHRAKDRVWVMHCGVWSKAAIRRRLPGGVYMAELVTYPGNGTLVTVSASTYGGSVATK